MTVPQPRPSIPRYAHGASAWPLLVVKLGILAICTLTATMPDIPTVSIATWRLVLGAFTALLIADARHFGIGVSLVLLSTLAWPVYTLIILGPSGDIMPLWNSRTHLIDKHFDVLVTGSVYLYTAVSLLLHIGDARAVVVDVPLLAELQRTMSTPGLSAVAALLAIALTLATYQSLVPPALKGIDYGTACGMQNAPVVIGSATGALAAVACALTLYGPPGRLRSLALVFTPAWFLLNWDRVIVVGLVGVYLTYFLWRPAVLVGAEALCTSTKAHRPAASPQRVLLLVVLVTMAYVLMTYIGLVRGTGRVRVDEQVLAALAEAIGREALGGTIEGCIYAGAVAVETANTQPHSQWLALAIGLLPDTLSPWGNPQYGAKYLSYELKATQGGLLLPFEGYLSDGPAGLLVYPFFCVLASAMLVWFWRRLLGPLALGCAYIVVFCMSIRTTWYGIQNMLSMLLLGVPLICVLLLVGEQYGHLLARPSVASSGGRRVT